MFNRLKPLYKPQDTAFIVVNWGKMLVMRIRIKRVKYAKFNGQIKRMYEFWRYRSANEAGDYWGVDQICEQGLFKTASAAWEYLDDHYDKNMIADPHHVVDEDPHMTPRQIKKYNKEYCPLLFKRRRF